MKTCPDAGTLVPLVPEEGQTPEGIDRRSFLMRSAVIGAAVVMTGTEMTSEARARRATLPGLLGKEPATVDPLFLDEMAAKPDQSYPVRLGNKTFNLSLADVIYDASKGDFPHPNTMTCKLMAGDQALHELETSGEVVRAGRGRAAYWHMAPGAPL